jgi:hypothetical protein
LPIKAKPPKDGGAKSDDGPRARPAGKLDGRGQARKLEREDELGIARQRNQSIDTLQVSARGTVSTGRQSPSGGSRNEAPKTGGAKPEGAKRTRGYGHLAGLNPPRVLRISDRSRPRGRRDVCWRRRATDDRQVSPTARRDGSPTRWSGWVEGGNPWSAKPGRGSRMKQACKVVRGGSRRERVKRCGRNVGGPGMPAGKWTRKADVAKRSRNPKEGARGRGSCASTALMLGPT